MIAEDSKRLAEIREQYDAGYEKAYGHIPWLLDQLASRDEEIERLKSCARGDHEIAEHPRRCACGYV